MRAKAIRAVISVLVAVGLVLAFRWTVRTALARAYRSDRDMGEVSAPVVQAPRVYSLAAIVPEKLRVNIAGLPIRKSGERLHMPYSLAVELADERARSAGWERIDNEGALTVQNLSGMERLYRTPAGSVVLREMRPLKGDDAYMEDFVVPVELLPDLEVETLLPDDLARRASRAVRELMPALLRDVVLGNPMMTDLIERGGGAAFIVHSIADLSAKDAEGAVRAAAAKAGWREVRLHPDGAGLESAPAAFEKENLMFGFEVVGRPGGAGCDINYRFTDDEVYIPKKGTSNED